MFSCKYCCSWSSPKKQAVGLHARYCSHNPNRVEYSAKTRAKIGEATAKRSVSLETRQKISRSRIQFLQEHPEMVPYRLNHYSKGRSYPEKYWKAVLENNHVKFVEQHQVSLYSLDFAVLDTKKCLEVDGEQHYADQRIVKSDHRRTTYLESLGWTLFRVRWSEYQKLSESAKKSVVDDLIQKLTT